MLGTGNTCQAVAVELSPPCPGRPRGWRSTPGSVSSHRPDSGSWGCSGCSGCMEACMEACCLVAVDASDKCSCRAGNGSAPAWPCWWLLVSPLELPSLWPHRQPGNQIRLAVLRKTVIIPTWLLTSMEATSASSLPCLWSLVKFSEFWAKTENRFWRKGQVC